MLINTFIISYNRLSFLKKQVEVLSKNPLLKLYIIDNRSTYPPLLEYLHQINVPVIFIGNNEGHDVIWKTNISKKLSPNEPYIVTDNDIIPEDENFMDILMEGLEKYPDINKIGLGLRTDDIPENNFFKDQIIKHECHGLKRENVNDPRFIRMAVDTTFAIYREGYHCYSTYGNNSVSDISNIKSLRTTQSLAKHLSWYITEEEMKNEENKFYFKSLKSSSTHWSRLQGNFFQ